MPGKCHSRVPCVAYGAYRPSTLQRKSTARPKHLPCMSQLLVSRIKLTHTRMHNEHPKHHQLSTQSGDCLHTHSRPSDRTFRPCRTRRFLRDINRPRPPGWGMLNFGWVKTVIAYTEEEVLQVAGWDAVVYLRILRFGAHAPDRVPPRACWSLSLKGGPRAAPGGSIPHFPSSARQAARECLHRRHAVRVPVPVVLHRRPADECRRGANLAHRSSFAACGSN